MTSEGCTRPFRCARVSEPRLRATSPSHISDLSALRATRSPPCVASRLPGPGLPGPSGRRASASRDRPPGRRPLRVRRGRAAWPRSPARSRDGTTPSDGVASGRRPRQRGRRTPGGPDRVAPGPSVWPQSKRRRCAIEGASRILRRERRRAATRRTTLSRGELLGSGTSSLEGEDGGTERHHAARLPALAAGHRDHPSRADLLSGLDPRPSCPSRPDRRPGGPHARSGGRIGRPTLLQAPESLRAPAGAPCTAPPGPAGTPDAGSRLVPRGPLGRPSFARAMVATRNAGPPRRNISL